MISTHILDLASGLPAPGVTVVLQKKQGEQWLIIKEEKTNGDGRISFASAPEVGTYQLHFQIDEYLKRTGQTPFFVQAPVIFHITDFNRKYHIPLLLSPFGYSTYRGS